MATTLPVAHAIAPLAVKSLFGPIGYKIPIRPHQPMAMPHIPHGYSAKLSLMIRCYSGRVPIAMAQNIPIAMLSAHALGAMAIACPRAVGP